MQKSWIWAGILLVFVAAGSYALYAFLQPRPLPEALLYGNGHIEGNEVRVAAEVAGRVVDSRLVEGATVARGDLLVRLDDTDLALRKERTEAEIEVQRRERERVERELQLARHHAETAERDLARYRELRERETVPPQRVEQAEDAFEETRARASALDAGLAAIDGRIEAAQKELALALTQIGKARITAPIDGTVLAKGIETGEFALPGRTVATLVDLSGVELTVFVPQREIGKITLGDAARVRVDAFPDRYFEARVARVDQGAQFTPRDIHMPDERVRMVFGVTLALDNPDGTLKPGMPADAWLLWQEGSEWPDRLFVPQ